MPADLMDRWLKSRLWGRLGSTSLRPVENNLMTGMVMSVQRGQAEAFVLEDTNGARWILKKFHQGRLPDRSYLTAISTVLPKAPEFVAGTDRRVLAAADLGSDPGHYHSPALARWLEGSVLMPCIPGLDWVAIADEVREGRACLGPEQRAMLCRNLASAIHLLEASGCAHRDIAAGNVLIDARSLAVSFIDFDSLYHPSVQMPPMTTCGTTGYAPPFGWTGANPDARPTWCPRADRFAMTILCVEFLVLGRGSPLTAEGGMFEQDDLCRRSGRSIALAKQQLDAHSPHITPLFEAAIAGKSFDDCPSPDAWLAACPGNNVAPPLAEIEALEADWLKRQLARRRSAAPIWSAPRLGDIPEVDVHIPERPTVFVSLPDDPWVSQA